MRYDLTHVNAHRSLARIESSTGFEGGVLHHRAGTAHTSITQSLHITTSHLKRSRREPAGDGDCSRIKIIQRPAGYVGGGAPAAQLSSRDRSDDRFKSIRPEIDAAQRDYNNRHRDRSPDVCSGCRVTEANVRRV